MYSPKISEDLIPLIYKRAKKAKRPMTKVVDEILREAFSTRKCQHNRLAIRPAIHLGN